MSIVQLLLWEDKVCRRCGQLKSYNLFPPSKINRDGLHCYCNQCMAERKRDYYQKNAERCRENGRQYYRANITNLVQYRLSHREKIASVAKAYRIKRPDLNRIYSRRYNYRKRHSTGKHSLSEWNELCQRHGNRCLCCGEAKALTVDHVIPLSHGGTDYIDNIQPLCQSCNSKKGTRHTDYRIRDT
jgi:5-methylcytosine-specific restriction endonuclease McrA